MRYRVGDTNHLICHVGTAWIHVAVSSPRFMTLFYWIKQIVINTFINTGDGCGEETPEGNLFNYNKNNVAIRSTDARSLSSTLMRT